MNSLTFYLRAPLGHLPVVFQASENKTMVQQLPKVYGRYAGTFWESSPCTVLLSRRDHAVVDWHTPSWEAPLYRLARRDQYGLLERRLDHILRVITHWDLSRDKRKMTTRTPSEVIQRTAQSSLDWDTLTSFSASQSPSYSPHLPKGNAYRATSISLFSKYHPWTSDVEKGACFPSGLTLLGIYSFAWLYKDQTM